MSAPTPPSFHYQPGRHKEYFATEFGQKLWTYLNEPRTQLILEITSRLRHPAVEGLDQEICERFANDLSQLESKEIDNYKRMIGHMIRQIMDHMDYELDAQRLKTRNPNNALFVSGSRYVRRKVNAPPSENKR